MAFLARQVPALLDPLGRYGMRQVLAHLREKRRLHVKVLLLCEWRPPETEQSIAWPYP